MRIEARLAELGLVLPEPLKPLPGVRLPFTTCRVVGTRAYIAGHAPLAPDGSMAGPFGKVGGAVTLEQGYEASRLTALAMIASLKRAIGDLDRVTAWLRVFGMVNVAPGFNKTPLVINGCSDLILEVFGEEVGLHARSAVGFAELPFDIPVEIEADVEISAD
jgi:enamine deaminase RidA (YjgF/YER057c/UK114 family)